MHEIPIGLSRMELGGYDNAILDPTFVPQGTLGWRVLVTGEGVIFMNWDQMQGKWMQMKGSAKKHWGKLTDDDLEFMAGSRDQFVGRLQERYGIQKEAAQKQADEWLQRQAEPKTTTGSTTHRSGGGA
jgi:uncharacterized protein YjbJ (UPF0337 family)